MHGLNLKMVLFFNKEFMEIQEELNDFDCLKALRKAKLKEANAKTISFEDAKKALNIE